MYEKSKERTKRQLASIGAKYFADASSDPLVLNVRWNGVKYEFLSYAEVSRWVQRMKQENNLK